jgi:hypothetical protein
LGLKGIFQNYSKTWAFILYSFNMWSWKELLVAPPLPPTKLLAFGITRFSMFFSLVQFRFSLGMKVLGPWPMGFTIILSKKWGILGFHMPWPKHFNVHTQNNSGDSLPFFLNTMQKIYKVQIIHYSLRSTNYTTYLFVTRAFRIYYENVHKISFLIKYYFNILLFHSILEKPLYFKSFIEYTKIMGSPPPQPFPKITNLVIMRFHMLFSLVWFKFTLAWRFLGHGLIQKMKYYEVSYAMIKIVKCKLPLKLFRRFTSF